MNASEFVWEQKYRPDLLDDVVIPKAFKESLRKYIIGGKIPNFLFYSPNPGTGKTTVAKAICNELGIKPLFINASLNNSVDDIRMMVVQYATTANMFGASQKVVILDEAERLSTAAQESLKGLIEQVSKNCSFVLTSNTKSRVIEPLRSRCTEVDFVYSTEEQLAISTQMLKRCTEILKLENVPFDLQVLVALVKKFSPDNRKILNELQRYSSENGSIDAGILGRLKGADSTVLVESLKNKKFDEVKAWCFDNFDRLGDEFYGQIFNTLSSLVTPQSVPQLVLVLNDYQRYHATVPDRFIHFTSLCTQIMVDVQFR